MPGTQVCPHDPPLPSSPAILGLTLLSWDILLAVCSSSVPGLCTRSFRFHALPLKAPEGTWKLGFPIISPDGCCEEAGFFSAPQGRVAFPGSWSPVAAICGHD